MRRTLDELERVAYLAGDVGLAEAYAALEDAEARLEVHDTETERKDELIYELAEALVGSLTERALCQLSI